MKAQVFASLSSAADEPQTVSINDPLRAEVRALANLAGEVVAPYWPMRTFISRNPLMGFEDRPFEQAVREAEALIGGKAYLENRDYRRWLEEGRIRLADLQKTVAKRLGDTAFEMVHVAAAGAVTRREVVARHVRWGFDCPQPEALGAELDHEACAWRLDPKLSTEQRLSVLKAAGTNSDRQAARQLWSVLAERLPPPPELPDIDASARGELASDLEALGRSATLAQWCDKVLGSAAQAFVQDQVIRWCAAFLDEGQAVWVMPERIRGLFGAWRYLSRWDSSPWLAGVQGFGQRVAELPEAAEDSVILSLQRLGIPRERWQGYMACHFARQPGWVGLIRWRASNAEYHWQRRHPATLIKYLAVSLFLEAEIVDSICRRTLGCPGRVSEITRYFRDRPAEYLMRTRLSKQVLPDRLRRRIERLAHSRRRTTNQQWLELAEAWRESGGEQDAQWRHAIQVWPLYQLAQYSAWSPAQLSSFSTEALQRLADWIAALPEREHGPLWLEALERSYRQPLIRKLAAAQAESAKGSEMPLGDGAGTIRPLAQALFCIDVRSEVFRRRLENLGGYETFGVAGFFGVPIKFVGFNSRYEAELCPVLLRPKHRVVELARPSPQTVTRHLTGSRIAAALRRAMHDMKANIVAPYAMVEAIGWVFGLPFIAKTVAASSYFRFSEGLRRWLMPPVPTTLTVDKPTPAEAHEQVYGLQRARISVALRRDYGLRRRAWVDQHVLEELRQAAYDETPFTGPAARTTLARRLGLDGEAEQRMFALLRSKYGVSSRHADTLLAQVTETGFTLDEQAYLVEATLRIIGLADGFARIVMICGHGSRSDNNPYESALDCGACGGDHGAANARVFVHMANSARVRERLRARGLVIPEDTWFVAAEHNTTTDEVTLFDLETAPPSHLKDLQQLQGDLIEAGMRCARERCEHLPDGPHTQHGVVAARHVFLRSVDWTQVRPEWGLAGNAAFIIGRRRALNVNTSGRSFLHSYDYRYDETGWALETIMTAPLVVAHWINMEYYFSCVDNAIYGSGSKVYHNVVGCLGVMSGNRSDLRIGLPQQTVMMAGHAYHEPMRLLAVVEAPRRRVADVVERNEVLRCMFNNQWATLAVLDPTEARIYMYEGGGWQPMPGEKEAPLPDGLRHAAPALES